MHSLFRMKVILVGDYGVSKTSMLNSLLSKYNGERTATNREYFQNETELRVKSSLWNDPVVMAIWDTCSK